MVHNRDSWPGFCCAFSQLKNTKRFWKVKIVREKNSNKTAKWVKAARMLRPIPVWFLGNLIGYNEHFKKKCTHVKKFLFLIFSASCCHCGPHCGESELGKKDTSYHRPSTFCTRSPEISRRYGSISINKILIKYQEDQVASTKLVPSTFSLRLPHFYNYSKSN